MTGAATVVDGLGKVGRLGQAARSYRTLRDSIVEPICERFRAGFVVSPPAPGLVGGT